MPEIDEELPPVLLPLHEKSHPPEPFEHLRQRLLRKSRETAQELPFGPSGKDRERIQERSFVLGDAGEDSLDDCGEALGAAVGGIAFAETPEELRQKERQSFRLEKELLQLLLREAPRGEIGAAEPLHVSSGETSQLDPMELDPPHPCKGLQQGFAPSGRIGPGGEEKGDPLGAMKKMQKEAFEKLQRRLVEPLHVLQPQKELPSRGDATERIRQNRPDAGRRDGLRRHRAAHPQRRKARSEKRTVRGGDLPRLEPSGRAELSEQVVPGKKGVPPLSGGAPSGKHQSPPSLLEKLREKKRLAHSGLAAHQKTPRTTRPAGARRLQGREVLDPAEKRNCLRPRRRTSGDRSDHTAEKMPIERLRLLRGKDADSSCKRSRKRR